MHPPYVATAAAAYQLRSKLAKKRVDWLGHHAWPLHRKNLLIPRFEVGVREKTMERTVLIWTVTALLAGCASPIYPITAYPATPDSKLAKRVCVEQMMREVPALGLVEAIAVARERQQVYNACMAAHGWQGGW